MLTKKDSIANSSESYLLPSYYAKLKIIESLVEYRFKPVIFAIVVVVCIILNISLKINNFMQKLHTFWEKVYFYDAT